MRTSFYFRWLKLLLLSSVILLAGCQDELFSNLQESQANEVVATLRAHGIDCAKKPGLEGQWMVTVDGSRFADSVSILRARGVPNLPSEGLGETFKKQGLVSTPLEERARLTHAMSEELSRTLNQIDGVVIARVHIVLPEKDLIADSPTSASATVFIKHRPDVNLNQQVAKIKAIVANGVDGLSYDNVSVALFPASQPAPLTSFIQNSPSSQSLYSKWLLIIGGGILVLGVAVTAISVLWGKSKFARSHGYHR